MSDKLPITQQPAPTRQRRGGRMARISILLLAIGVVFLGRPVAHLVSTAWRDVDEREPVRSGYVDDASRDDGVATFVASPIAMSRRIVSHATSNSQNL